MVALMEMLLSAYMSLVVEIILDTVFFHLFSYARVLIVVVLVQLKLF
jgi:hypothetical protein